jgi:hypothetical protein
MNVHLVSSLEPEVPEVGRSNGFDGLIGTFADACRIADRQHRERIKTREERRQPQLAESTKQALDFLLNVNDADRLHRFIAEHPRTEARLILAYVKERRS